MKEVRYSHYAQSSAFSLNHEQKCFNLTSINLQFLKIGLIDFRFHKSFKQSFYITKASKTHLWLDFHFAVTVQFMKSYWKGGKRVIKIKFQIIFSNGGNWVFEMRKRVFEKEEIKSLKCHTYEKSMTA